MSGHVLVESVLFSVGQGREGEERGGDSQTARPFFFSFFLLSSLLAKTIEKLYFFLFNGHPGVTYAACALPLLFLCEPSAFFRFTILLQSVTHYSGMINTWYSYHGTEDAPLWEEGFHICFFFARFTTRGDLISSTCSVCCCRWRTASNDDKQVCH